MNFKSQLFLLLALLFAPPVFATGLEAVQREIPEFHQVSEGIYRGGHPSPKGLEELARLGVKTDLNLENEYDTYLELIEARRVGLSVIEVPMSGFWDPNDKDADEILAALADPSKRPIFIHCTYGQDRTGLMVGLYRVLFEKWSPAASYEEMLGYNFHPNLLFPLDEYFRFRTGYND